MSFPHPLLIVLLLLSSLEAHAARAIVRDERTRKLEPIEYSPEDLVETGVFSGRYFRIVAGTSEEALPLDHAEAGNIYYHLTRSRKFFERLGRGRYEVFPIVVRAGMTVQYDQFDKFSKARDEHNESQSIRGVYSLETRSWSEVPEIWFHAPRVVQKKLKPWFCLIRAPGKMSWLWLSPLCTKTMPYDSARIEEAIAHEYAHVAVGIALGKATVVNEPYSDYFAAAISGSSVFPRAPRAVFPPALKYDLVNDLKYEPEFEDRLFRGPGTGLAFVAGYLWELRRALGAYQADRAIYGSTRTLDRTSKIIDIPAAVAAACESESCRERVLEIALRRGIPRP